jgi:UDP-N-acetylmuramate dehydrogenase
MASAGWRQQCGLAATTSPGVTLLMDIAGQAITQQDESGAVVSVGAGVNWHDFVIWTLDQSLTWP